MLSERPRFGPATDDREPRTVEEYVSCRVCGGTGRAYTLEGEPTPTNCPTCSGVGSVFNRSFEVRP